MSTIPVIAIDGPSGSGKGTVSLGIAQSLGWHLLDSGALYRVLALAVQQQGIALEDESAVAELALNLKVRFPSHSEGVVLLDEVDVTTEIRSEKAGNSASKVAALPKAREALLERQRAFRQPPGLVADGRDMGTVVFTDAGLKVFLTASPEKRAKRRYKQLIEKGMDANLSALIEEIAERDRRDSKRRVAPLKPAPDAVIIDTSSMDIASSISAVRRLVTQRMRL